MEVMPNILFRTLLTNVSIRNVHVAKHMTIRHLCTKLATILDQNEVLSTSAMDTKLDAVVSFVQTDNDITFSPRSATIQAQID